ncbi:integrase, catalytic region, zinc finger, CCHC-type containing protein [Tanacetum coccineum]
MVRLRCRRFKEDKHKDRETKNRVVQDTSSSAQQDAMIMFVIKEMSNQVTECKKVDKENKIIHESLTVELERYREQINFFEERQKCELNDREKYIDGQLRKLEKSYLDEYAECGQLKAELSKKNDMVEKADAPEFLAFFKINELKAQLKAKDNSINKLKDHIATLKGKCVSEGDKSKNTSKEIAPGMYKIDLEPFSPKLLRNKEAHVDYVKHTQENTDTLREIVKQAREFRSLDSDLDSALKPKSKNKKVRFAEPSTSSSNTQKLVDSCKTKDTNKPLLPSTGVISFTSASGSKPPGNTKKSRILRKTSSNKKNKVEDHLRSLICATCNECMFDAIHDLGVLEYVNDVNVHVKSKCVKSKKKKLWKPTGKVFTDVKYSWKPTSQTFTIDANTCPLTRITSTTVVPPKKPISPTIVKKTPPNSNNSGKLKDITNIRSSSKSKSVESKISNNSEPNKNWGSNVSTSLSPSRVHFRSFKSSSSTWTQVALSKGQGNALSSSTLLVNSWVYYVEGLGHNLFSVGQFCDFDLEVAFRKHTCYIRDLEGVNLLKGSWGLNLYTMSLEEMMQPSTICLFSKASKTKSWLWHKRLSHLNFGYINELAKQGLAEAVATACYTQNRSLIRRCYNKTPYEYIHDRKPDLTYFHVFSVLCYPTNDGEDLGKLKPKADIRSFFGYAPAKKAYRIYNRRTRLIMETIYVEFDELTAMASEQYDSGSELKLMTHGTISSGLVHNPPSIIPYVPPTKNDWDLLFQPMFNKYFYPLPSILSLVHAAVALRPADPIGSPSSTSIDQDAPSASTSLTIQET